MMGLASISHHSLPRGLVNCEFGYSGEICKVLVECVVPPTFTTYNFGLELVSVAIYVQLQTSSQEECGVRFPIPTKLEYMVETAIEYYVACFCDCGAGCIRKG